MDYKAIQELIETVSKSDLTSLELESDGLKIVMKKEVEKVLVQNTAPVVTAEVQKVEPTPVVSAPSPAAQPQPSVSMKEDKNEKLISSPIVGTFYAASGPEAEDFVKVGDQVKKGDTLCIIEAMKLMNEIESEVDGTVTEILVKNEQMVEYGQPLFKISL